MKFAQGDFEPQNFNMLPCLSKLMNFLILTIIGSIMFVIIEVLDSLKNILKLFGLLFGGSKGVEKVKECFTNLKSKLTGLNAYQLNSIEQQRKVFALYFENVPYTILLVCIQFGLLDCEELRTGKARAAVVMALCLTLVQVIVTIGTTYIESRWL